MNQSRLAHSTTLLVWLVFAALHVWGTAHAGAATISEARDKFNRGEYELAMSMAREAIDAGTWSERWPRLLMRGQLVTGQYEAAVETYEAAMRRYSSSLQLRILGIEAYRHVNNEDQANSLQVQIFDLLQRSPSRYSGSENLITAGRYFADRGEDARKILELFYDRVRDRDPNYVGSYIATAELAISKHDYSVAAESLETALKLAPEDPEIHFLAARAWAPSEPSRAEQALNRALELNPRHIPSLLYLADRWIDRERYDNAVQSLAQVEAVNPKLPRLWAYRSVLAHLKGNAEEEKAAREKALEPWPRNPEVDHLIGRKLSQKYRFAEGAASQRRALEFDPSFTEARFQLAQDLLRLGQDEAGWELARWVNEEDAYNVVAYNLMTLRDTLQTFRILRRGNFLVRMASQEADIYGPEVLDLLTEAESVLCEKYDLPPDGPIVVEIFPRQQDFAIRTFGLPGGDGFLGVCFGRVITANSPASQGPDPANWKSVLWHEFCHVVTLEKTNNRMPRWLSEGISVYEERLRDATWGQSMTPTFRQMLLGEDLVPLSELSGAFLAPPSPMHLQLAYFESSLAVEFLIDNFGLETLNQVLVDLGAGVPINDALQQRAGSLDKLDEAFASFVRARARIYGCHLDWSDDEMPEQANSEQWRAWLESRPNNYWGLRGLADALLSEDDARAALEPLQTILDAFPDDAPEPSTTLLLATTYRQLDDTAAERQTLETYEDISPAGFPALLRLMQLQADAGDWVQVLQTARKALEVNPLDAAPHQRLVDASEALGTPGEAARSLEVLATLNPVDPAKLHLQTARAWLAKDDHAQAKRQILMALEEAPHYREAQDLLLQLTTPQNPPASSPPSSAEKANAEGTETPAPPLNEVAPQDGSSDTPSADAPSSDTPAPNDSQVSNSSLASEVLYA